MKYLVFTIIVLISSYSCAQRKDQIQITEKYKNSICHNSSKELVGFNSNNFNMKFRKQKIHEIQTTDMSLKYYPNKNLIICNTSKGEIKIQITQRGPCLSFNDTTYLLDSLKFIRSKDAEKNIKFNPGDSIKAYPNIHDLTFTISYDKYNLYYIYFEVKDIKTKIYFHNSAKTYFEYILIKSYNEEIVFMNSSITAIWLYNYSDSLGLHLTNYRYFGKRNRKISQIVSDPNPPGSRIINTTTLYKYNFRGKLKRKYKKYFICN